MSILPILLSNQAANILIGSALACWTLIIAHWGHVSLVKRISLWLFVPLVVVGSFFGLLILYGDSIDRAIQADHISYIRAKSDKVASELDALSTRIEDVNRALSQSAVDLITIQGKADSLNASLDKSAQTIISLLTKQSADIKDVKKVGSNLSQSLEQKRFEDFMNQRH